MKRNVKLTGIITIWAVFFVVFCIVSIIAGGDAVNGKIENGRYYLCNTGKYTQVPRVTYVAPAAAVAIIAAGPVLMSLMLVSFFSEGKKRRALERIPSRGFFLNTRMRIHVADNQITRLYSPCVWDYIIETVDLMRN
jgi:hypothetical protein